MPEHGDKVIITAKYKRNYTYNSATWVPHGIKNTLGIFLGYRTLKNGVLYDDYGTQFEPKEYVKAGLVSISPHMNPIYVPLDYMM